MNTPLQVLQGMLRSQPIEYELTGFDEQRLLSLKERLLRDDPTAIPPGEPWVVTRGILIGAMLDRGLRGSERDDGIWYAMSGHVRPYPKIPLRLRLKLAWEELRGPRCRM